MIFFILIAFMPPRRRTLKEYKFIIQEILYKRTASSQISLLGSNLTPLNA
ncbi:hypothetical protein [uncultured Campylobacter sp.]|nr:hypothetical protein [uncultured Campylobacter sp.]